MNFERARAIADAILMEGYALYPYRASAPKNRFRWTFGVIAPKAWSAAGGCEPWWLGTQILVAGTPARIAGRLRCFQIDRRRGATPLATWDEGVLHEIDFAVTAGTSCVPLAFPGGPGRHAIEGAVVITCTPVAAAEPLVRVSIRIENHTPWPDAGASREQALLGALASTHLVVGVDGGRLLSAIDPPAWARDAAAQCANERLYPVLLDGDDLVIATPFILYDHPQVAPESVGDLCDATEIDELLTLRTRLLTDDEKREARATDPRAAAIIDRADLLTDDALARMHGASRDLRDGEMVPHLAGTKVRLLAPRTRTDAQDLLYAGRVATVVEVREDVDGTTFLGVTIDDDPAAELYRWYGRCHYYRLDEVEVL